MSGTRAKARPSAPAVSSDVTKVEVPVSAAQLAALHSSPVPVVPGPPAGHAIAVVSASFYFRAGSVSYSGGDECGLAPDGGGAFQDAFAFALGGTRGIIRGSSDAFVTTPASQGTQIGIDAFDGTALVFGCFTDDFTGGDGYGRLVVWYSTVSLP
jgi:hypothetical protein